MSSIFTIIPWLLLALVCGTLNITSAIFLLRDRNQGPMLMLAGSFLGLVGGLGSALNTLLMIRDSSPSHFRPWMIAISGLSYLGSFLFSVGLLLHALHLRGKADRIAELEAILNSRNG